MSVRMPWRPLCALACSLLTSANMRNVRQMDTVSACMPVLLQMDGPAGGRTLLPGMLMGTVAGLDLSDNWNIDEIVAPFVKIVVTP